MSSALIVHGHFYQPPRENPWSGLVDREPSAAPFRDWNERIQAECYRPNSVARIVDERGRLLRIVDNYAHLSFDFGPTLLSWMERAHPATYARILAADRRSVALRGGHGNAMAHGHGHAILPLCSDRDLVTQVRWGLADFRHRFGREAESLWCPETAVDERTMRVLSDHGLRYVLLSPYQAARVRVRSDDGARAWVDVSGGRIDPGVAYRWVASDGSGRSLAVFFYDGAIARGIAFEGLLGSSEALVARFAQAARGGDEGRVVNVATDGESYGHHFKWGDRGLAYALEVEAPRRGLRVTNYGEFLENHPPRFEVQLEAGPAGEGSSWSCAHGVGRWIRDCGCSTGGRDGWDQRWRGPLRNAMDVVRDATAAHLDDAGAALFADPWGARDAYIDVLLGRASADAFLRVHARSGVANDPSRRTRALALLEASRHAMLAYTSCGWFFSDLSGIETLQVMRYAGRALDLLAEAGGAPPERRFLDVLGAARSNLDEHGTGVDLWRRHVVPTRVTSETVTANVAISAVARAGREAPSPQGEAGPLHGYETRALRLETRGSLTLATARISVVSRATGSEVERVAAALHLGGVDFTCALRPFVDEADFLDTSEQLWEAFPRAGLPALLRLLHEAFGPAERGLEAVLPSERERISEALLGELAARIGATYAQAYEDQARTIDLLHAAGFPLPRELRVAAEIALARRFDVALRVPNGARDAAAYGLAVRIADEARARGFALDLRAADELLAKLVHASVEGCIAAASRGAPPDELRAEVLDLVRLAARLGASPDLDRAQEALYGAILDGCPISADDPLLEALHVSPLVTRGGRVLRDSAAPREPEGREGTARP
jgi:alpha-amylase/alpha-mannosidase (GH57 family)